MAYIEMLQTVLGLSGVAFLMIGAYTLKWSLKKYMV